jgi:type I restriction enzyme S subunit
MVLRSKGLVDNLFSYFVLKSEDVLNQLQILAELRSGTFPQITFFELDKIMVNIPHNELLEKYTLFLWGIYNKIIDNQHQIRTLTHLRDTLLPKLMSGKLEVKNEKL